MLILPKETKAINEIVRYDQDTENRYIKFHTKEWKISVQNDRMYLEIFLLGFSNETILIELGVDEDTTIPSQYITILKGLKSLKSIWLSNQNDWYEFLQLTDSLNNEIFIKNFWKEENLVYSKNDVFVASNDDYEEMIYTDLIRRFVIIAKMLDNNALIRPWKKRIKASWNIYQDWIDTWRKFNFIYDKNAKKMKVDKLKNETEKGFFQ